MWTTMRLQPQGQSCPNDVLRGSRGLRPRLRADDGVLFVVADVDYVLIDDGNYDQTTRLNHTVLAGRWRRGESLVRLRQKK